MVTDAELATRLHTHLAAADLTTTTTTILRRKLENDLGLDLSDRKVFLRQQVECFLQNQYENSEEEFYRDNDADSDDEGDGDDDDDENTTSSSEEEEDGDGVAEEGKAEGGSGGGDAIAAGNGNRRVRRGAERYDGLNKEPKKTPNGFSKLFVLSPQLQKFLGASEMAQPKVLQQIWSYIREKSLQDPMDKKNIICDDSLRPVFGVDSINMFEINKALSKHLKPMDAAPAKKKRRSRQRKQKREEDLDDLQRDGKQQRKNLSGFLAPARLSPTLVEFLGTGESELTRATVISRIWDYIKDKHLQDPMDTRMVLCDEKLKELLGVDSFRGFAVSKLLSPHLRRG
ncbi:Upstream activation factor subunit spp27-like protein [Drosera capensis]